MIKVVFKNTVKVMADIDLGILDVKYLFHVPQGDRFMSQIKSITFGCPSELVPSREEVLTQLGITKEQDEANQKEWQCK